MTKKNETYEQPNLPDKTLGVTWNPLIGVLLVFGIYIISQLIGLVILIYPAMHHFTAQQTSNWLNNSIYGQFVYVFLVESVVVAGVLLLLKMFKIEWQVIGLRRFRSKDWLYGLAAVPIYYLLYIAIVGVLTTFIKSLNVSQQQTVGFTNAHGLAQLIVTLISLVILPPIAEEILVRGFLYSSLKKGLPQVAAAILTSVIFASAHLPEAAKGLLWIGFIDTFILSIVLVYLREKSGALWAGMITHGFKNGVAYYILYLAPLIKLHL